MRTARTILAGLLAVLASACSVKQYAVNTIGDMLAAGDSVYESDDDIVLIGDALPFSLKLVESLLNESPNHVGLLLTAARGYVLYAYAYVHHEADVIAVDDIQQARQLRTRARKLYMRAHGYAARALEQFHPGLPAALQRQPQQAAATIGTGTGDATVPQLYWMAASLGLAIAVSKNDAAMLARLPEVEALLERALVLDEAWDEGALHEFMVNWSAAQPHGVGAERLRQHYERALELSGGRRASLFVAYAEAVAIPAQDRRRFQELVDKALAVDLEADPGHRLMNVIAQRRANWLVRRIDELFLL